MLTNVELVIMRFIRIRPSYAYELEKIIKDWKLSQWVKIGGVTIYKVLNRLCQNELLRYEIEKDGNMPERRRYYITDKGNELILDSLREILINIEPYYFELSIGIACRQFIEKEEFRELIKIRLDKLNSFINDFNDIFERSKEFYPYRKIAMREYLLSHYKLEKSLLEKLLITEEGQNE